MCVQPRGDGVYRGGWWEVPDRPPRTASRETASSFVGDATGDAGVAAWDSAGSPEQRASAKANGGDEPSPSRCWWGDSTDSGSVTSWSCGASGHCGGDAGWGIERARAAAVGGEHSARC